MTNSKLKIPYFILLTGLLIFTIIHLPIVFKKLDLIAYQKEQEENKEHLESEENKEAINKGRAEAEFKMLKNPLTNMIPPLAQRKAYAVAERALKTSLKTKARNATLPAVTITERGPTNFGGRSRSVDFDSRNQQIGLAGGVSGGIFRTTDGGANWTDVTPPGQIHNVTTIAQDRSTGNENTWYAAGGEQGGGTGNSRGAVFHGNGVWKSTDNGLTWSLLPSTAGVLEANDSPWDFVHRILVDPSNGNVYAGNSQGLYRSTDGGTNWTQIIQALNNNTITEIIRTTDGTFYAALNGDGIYKSTTGNIDGWIYIGGEAEIGLGTGRIILAFAPSANNLVYALFEGNTQTCGEFQSPSRLRRWDNTANGGNGAWTGNYDALICGVMSAQNGYNMALAVRPNNGNEVFFGGITFYRLTVTGNTTGSVVFAGGAQVFQMTNTTAHADIHSMLFTNDNLLWVATDGGIYNGDMSNAPSNGFVWANKNQGFVTYQYYRGDITPDVTSNMMGGGAQDNGTTILPANTSTASQVYFGDGFQFYLLSGKDATDYVTIASTQASGIGRRKATGNEEIMPGGPNNGYQGFFTYFLLDGDNKDYFYYPITNGNTTSMTHAELFRTRISATVNSSITGNSATGWQRMTLNGIAAQNNISAMATSLNAGYNGNAYTASDVNRQLYIGTDAGRVYRVSDPAFAAALNLTDITPTAITAGSYISSISVNPANDKEIMVTISNYGVSSIFHTMDASAATVVWTVIEGVATGPVALASIRSSIILTIGNTTVYLVGTSTGLYGTTMLNGTTTAWERIGATEIAYALCVDMKLRTADNKVALATHGNGMYLLDFSSNTGCIATLSLNDNPIAAGVYQSSNTITSTGTVASNTSVTMDAKTSITLQPNFSALAGSTFTAKIGGCNAFTLPENDRIEEVRKVIEPVDRPLQKEVEFSLYPSPASAEVTVDFNLSEPTSTYITLHHANGTLMKVLQSNKENSAGQQQLSFYAGEFPSGLYYVVISTPQIRKSQKLMIVK